MKTVICIVLFLFCTSILLGQKIDNMVSFRNIPSDKYIRGNYENDFFTSSDYDYSQGVSFEWVDPAFKQNPVNFILIMPKSNSIRYGLSMEHLVYTPKTLDTYEIQYGQRPFAATFMIKSFIIATDTINKSRLSTSFSIGLIGQGAGGGNMQKVIHRITGSETPNGWYYQIQNDFIVNYDLNYEKQLLRADDYFVLNASGGIKLGSLFTNASLGLNASIGIINPSFTSAKNNKKFQLYVYSQSILNAIGYDATLQGGLFNRNSPYTISQNDIERLTLHYTMGIVLQFSRFYLEYAQTFLTREIRTANAHNWGSIRIGYKL